MALQLFRRFGATSTFLKVNNFFIQSQTGETIAGFWTDGKVDLKYDGDTKLETLTDGVEISGDLYVKRDTIEEDGTDLGLVEDAIVKLNQTGGNGYNFDEWSYTTYSACEYSVLCKPNCWRSSSLQDLLLWQLLVVIDT